jgi:hypothetical protein
MDDQPTCGKGFAEHSVLPAKVGELIAATAVILEVHQTALDLSDENARREHEAYLKLAQEHRGAARQLRVLSEHMAGYRDLPIGRHDERALTSQQALAAFVEFVRIEQELLDLLQTAVDRDQKMLANMRETGP